MSQTRGAAFVRLLKVRGSNSCLDGHKRPELNSMSVTSLQPRIQEVRYLIGSITYERSCKICDQVINTTPLSFDPGSIAQC